MGSTPSPELSDFFETIKCDNLVKSQKRDGTVKSPKCKLSLAKSRLSKTALAVRGLANPEDDA